MADPEDMAEAAGGRPSAFFLALDGDEAAEKSLKEGSQEALRLMRGLMKQTHDMKVRAGVKQSVDMDTLGFIFSEEGKEYLGKLQAGTLSGAKVLPDALNEKAFRRLAGADRDRFAQVARDMGLQPDPKAPGKILLPVLPRENYAPHITKPYPRAYYENPEGFLKERYPGKSAAEIDQMVNGGGRRAIMSYARFGDELDNLETDIPRMLESMMRNDGEMIANAATWGGDEALAMASAFGDFAASSKPVGNAANAFLNALPTGKAKEAARAMMTRKYNKEVSEMSRMGRTLTGGVSNSLLTYAGLTSLAETHKGLWAVGGLKAAMKGRAYVADVGQSNIDELWAQSGAATNPVADLVSNITSRERQSVLGALKKQSKFAAGWEATEPLEIMARTERALRETVSYGNLDFIRTTAKRAAAQADTWEKAGKSGPRFSKRVMKEASEIFPAETSGEAAAARLATEFKASGGKMSKDIYMEGIGNLTQRQFYTTAVGFIGDAMKSSGGSVLFQYKPFLLQAGKHFYQDIIDPIIKGSKPSNWGSGLATLGYGRLARAVPAAGAAAGASSGLRLAAQGRFYRPEEENKEAFIRRTMDLIGGNLGLQGEALAAFVEAAFMGDTRRAADQLGSVPVLSVLSDVASGVVDTTYAAVFDDKDVRGSDAVRLLGRIAGMGVPKAPAVTNVIAEKLRAEEEKQKLFRGER